MENLSRYNLYRTGARLIQRLKKPRMLDMPASIAFRESLGRNLGGFSEEELERIQHVFHFMYMGASEYEHGSIHASYYFVCQQAHNDNLVCGKHQEVFYISTREFELSTRNIISQLIEDESAIAPKRGCYLANALKDPMGWGSEVCGWLDLNYGFFFFTDEEMFEKTKQLLGIS